MLIVEGNQKTITRIYISHHLTGSYTSQHLTDLRTLAGKCPFTDGIAVYQARALLSIIDTVVYMNICEMSDSLSSNMRMFSLTEEIYDMNFSVYPNPAKNEITIEYDLAEHQQGQIIIYNILGERIADHLLPPKVSSVQMSVLDIVDGIYLYVVSVGGTLITSGKLLIQK